MATEVKQVKDVPAVVQAALQRHGKEPEALIPILNEVNEELGYLPTAAMTEISRALHMPDSELLSTASFYSMLSTKPRGRHVIKYCESAPCHIMGGRKVWPLLKEALGIQPGETSPDGKWTLLAGSCPGICGVGPVMLIDDVAYGNITPQRLYEILASYE